MARMRRLRPTILVALVAAAGCVGGGEEEEEAGYRPDDRHFRVVEQADGCASGGSDIFCTKTLAVRVPEGQVYCDVDIRTTAMVPAQSDPFFSNASGYRVTDYPSRCPENAGEAEDVRVQLWSRTRGPYGPGPSRTDLTVRAVLLDLGSEHLSAEDLGEAVAYCRSLRPTVLAHLPAKVRVPADRETMFRPDSACAPGECRDCYCTEPLRHYYNVVDEIDESMPGCVCEKACK